MAKVYNPQGTYFDCCQALLIAHVTDVTAPPPGDFHVIALWNTYFYNPWDLVALVKWDPDNQLDWGTVTPQQLELAALLMHNPELISASCSSCRETYAHPWKLVWNINRGPRGEHVYPACCWDPTWWPPHFTPDFWPPVYPPY